MSPSVWVSNSSLTRYLASTIVDSINDWTLGGKSLQGTFSSAKLIDEQRSEFDGHGRGAKSIPGDVLLHCFQRQHLVLKVGLQ